MAISGLSAIISQPYPTPGAAAPKARTRDLVGQKSNALPTAIPARLLAGFDREYEQWLLGVHSSVTGHIRHVVPWGRLSNPASSLLAA
ncbi:unnamed protein product [Schistocephalus solidus]|uniref:Transposase n=1 Tax=Schistocephalus solidus TaxID=70667 RepID=A0A183TSF2_SCHSO|nr:unnamed protein product [Schistocephalus solidus]